MRHNPVFQKSWFGYGPPQPENGREPRCLPTTKTEFEVIRRSKVSEEVTKQIERMIAKRLHPGDKLPAERELAEMFAVSRSSVRNAIRTLELVGLVEPRQGMGTVVRELSDDSLVNPLAGFLRRSPRLSDLLDFRKIIEPPLAARAATHASAEQIADMGGILRRQHEKVRQGKTAIDEDSEFHYAVAMASDNKVVPKVLNVLMELLRETREHSLQVEGRPQKSLAGHGRILVAIRRHDPAGAEAAMQRHIEDVEEIVLDKLWTGES
jgi:GntR family transcriptional repressor for pyruvate dehydrogenase complex